MYKNMPTDNRRAFKFENVRKCLSIQCNNFNGKITTKKILKIKTSILMFFFFYATDEHEDDTDD